MTKNILIKHYIAAGIISICVIGVIIMALITTGGPFFAQSKAYDQQMTSDISRIKGAIDNYVEQIKELPISLSVLPSNLKKNDPKTNEIYSYSKIDRQNYQICANFETDSPKNADSYYAPSPEYTYKKGINCFKYNVNIYIPLPPTVEPPVTIYPTETVIPLTTMVASPLTKTTPGTNCNKELHTGIVTSKTESSITILIDKNEGGGLEWIPFENFHVTYREEPLVGDEIQETISTNCNLELKKL